MLCVSPRSRFTVEVRQPMTTHAVEYARFAKSMNERTGSQREPAVEGDIEGDAEAQAGGDGGHGVRRVRRKRARRNCFRLNAHPWRLSVGKFLAGFFADLLQLGKLMNYVAQQEQQTADFQ
jgi:hypothetical protein